MIDEAGHVDGLVQETNQLSEIVGDLVVIVETRVRLDINLVWACVSHHFIDHLLQLCPSWALARRPLH